MKFHIPGPKFQTGKKTPPRSNRNNPTSLIGILFIVILGFAAYANSLNGEFILDDHCLIYNNDYIKDYSRLPEIFTKGIGAGAGRKTGSYRPVFMLTLMADYSLWRLDAKGYHLTNIVLHILTAICVYRLIDILYAGKVLSLLTALLFLIHPIHTETVAYISGRADSLAALFVLLCLIFYIRQIHTGSIGAYILAVFSYICALLSKESSLILPVLLLYYHYTFFRRPGGGLFPSAILPLIGIALVYVGLRITVLKYLLPPIPSSTTVLQRIPGFFVAISSYIRLLLVPVNLHMEYGNQLFDFSSPQAISGVAILLFLSAYTLRRGGADRLALFSIPWFFIMLLPTSNIYPVNAYMAEHWLYLPSIGFFLILAKGLSYLYRAKGVRFFSIMPIVIIFVFYSYMTVRQNGYWRQPLVFYERTLRYAPHSAMVHNNLGVIYADRGETEKAGTFYMRAIEIDPGYAMAYYNLGNLYTIHNKTKEAIDEYRRTIEIDPDYAEAHNNLAVAYYHERRYDLAIKYCDRAVELGHKVHPEFLEHLKPYRPYYKREP